MKITVDLDKFITLVVEASLLRACLDINEKSDIPQNMIKNVANRIKSNSAIQDAIRKFKLNHSNQIPKGIL